ncbi:homeobox domain-containing protein [Ditylenchus destructor]|uniref:Homeobox domain-containing protein n=1 Tax=Ditylenchus destructor TaxID=166010 RepID=A0AAD4MVN6_9BILA|nr:homeobox domain-containing protein [Ditylenchus destructor]
MESISTMRTKKNRRDRTRFSASQLQILENYFSNCNLPDIFLREKIAQEVQLPEARIQVWFKNRRAKKRQEEKQKPNDGISSIEANTFSNAASPVENNRLPRDGYSNFNSALNSSDGSSPSSSLMAGFNWMSGNVEMRTSSGSTISAYSDSSRSSGDNSTFVSMPIRSNGNPFSLAQSQSGIASNVFNEYFYPATPYYPMPFDQAVFGYSPCANAVPYSTAPATSSSHKNIVGNYSAAKSMKSAQNVNNAYTAQPYFYVGHLQPQAKH